MSDTNKTRITYAVFHKKIKEIPALLKPKASEMIISDCWVRGGVRYGNLRKSMAQEKIAARRSARAQSNQELRLAILEGDY